MRQIILSFFLFIWMAGCVLADEQMTPSLAPETPKITNQSSVTHTPPTAIKTTYNVVQAGLTRTVSPMPMVSPTSTPESTPLSTVSAVDKDEFVRKLLTTDFICQLPCFGGITPGETKWSDAKTLLSSIASDDIFTSGSIYNVPLIRPVGDDSGTIYLSLYLNISRAIDLIGAPRYEYTVQKILADYGPPQKIYLFVLDEYPGDPDPINMFELLFFYPNYSFLAAFTGLTNKGSALEICPSKYYPGRGDAIYFWIWSPDDQKTVQDIFLRYYNGLYEYRDYKPINTVTDMSPVDFYFRYSKNDAEPDCFEISNPNTP